MKIPSGGGVGMVNSPLVTQVNLNSYHLLKLPFKTCGEFIIPTTCGLVGIIPSLPLLLKGLRHCVTGGIMTFHKEFYDAAEK
jgi:hypothetical protein